ncbi:MAG: hypothetical protein QM817_16350 [Archangium sp.]
MKILNSAMRAVQAATSKAAKALEPRVDSFHGGVRVSVGKAEAHATPRAVGFSVKFGEDTFGASVKPHEGGATLGVITQKFGKSEVSIGMMPAAPAPLPVPVYVGPVRDE